jgi:hypothetical protein
MDQTLAIKTIQCRDDASTTENLTLYIAEVKFRRVAVSMLLDAAAEASTCLRRRQGGAWITIAHDPLRRQLSTTVSRTHGFPQLVQASTFLEL